MRNFFTILCICSLFLCCKSKHGKGDYFEGYVEFKMEYHAKDENRIKIYKSIMGDKTVSYINSEGFYSKEYIDSNNIIFTRSVYRPDSLAFYFFSNTSDTIIKIKSSDEKNEQLILFEPSSPKVIGVGMYNGFQCTYKSYNKTLKEYFTFSTIYYYDSSLKLNPQLYKNVVYGGIEKIYSTYPYVNVGLHINYNLGISSDATATRIVPTKISDAHFEIPKDKVIVSR